MEYYWSILLFIVISIHYLFRNFNFFKRHGIIHIPPVPVFGAMISSMFFQTSFVDCLLKIYNFNPNAKYYGFYFMTTPVFLLRDPELIKNILVKNFESFPNRLDFSGSNDSLLKNNLFSLCGEKWRNVRNLLTPSFTSNKIKMMFTLISESAQDFAKFITTLPADKGCINMKDAFSKYTNDVIATCAFGIKINSMKDPTNEFYINEHITRPDMLQLMMDIRGKEGRRELDIDDMTAQAFIFFLGGFETSSTAISFVAHEIAANPDVQTKLQQEVDNILKESNGEVSYEAINRLEYLNAVISEALRLYPPFPILERICEKAYELPSALPDEKPVILKKGMTVWVPAFAIQRDEKYYDNPEKFDPERFVNNKMHDSSCYIPFGLGPRMCIANRFAMLAVKVLLFHLLALCELKPSAKTTSPVKFRKDLMIMPENGFWLNIQRRKDVLC
ncbi:PREDICTED: cytochrome P450 9e2-like [Trachymyrmex cornetzi]|uniref:cytochrome P450 9e2-like n=1 Tax=Trachymyrmex cornetzi TaxID=471704 RepID=UPI00084EEC81|nr:PREDICTED: cytochrome P450 9e2-like [Trachymyrmex cornetzi]